MRKINIFKLNTFYKIFTSNNLIKIEVKIIYK